MGRWCPRRRWCHDVRGGGAVAADNGEGIRVGFVPIDASVPSAEEQPLFGMPSDPPSWSEVVVVVVGGSGYLGAQLVRQLLHGSDAGDGPLPASRRYPGVRSVRVVDVQPPPSDWRHHPHISFFAARVGGNSTLGGSSSLSYASVFEGAHVCFYVASADSRTLRYGDAYATNVRGALDCLQLAQKYHLRAFVLTSSHNVVCAFDRDLCDADEHTAPIPPRHRDVYSATKAEAERRILASDGRTTGVRTCAIRPARQVLRLSPRASVATPTAVYGLGAGGQSGGCAHLGSAGAADSVVVVVGGGGGDRSGWPCVFYQRRWRASAGAGRFRVGVGGGRHSAAALVCVRALAADVRLRMVYGDGSARAGRQTGADAHGGVEGGARAQFPVRCGDCSFRISTALPHRRRPGALGAANTFGRRAPRHRRDRVR
eukprot:ctg_198.g143